MTGTINSIIPEEQQRDIICRLREEFKVKIKEAMLGKVTANTPKWKAQAINDIYIHPANACQLVSGIKEIMESIVDLNYDVCKKYKKRKYK
jgi:NAD kinase